MKGRVSVIPLLLIMAGAAIPQAAPPVDGESESYRFSVDVDLVVLPLTVTDRRGVSISSLRGQDFQIYEDGIRQSIRLFRHDDIPITVGLVIDHSGSMKKKLPEVVAAARAFVHSSNPDDQMFVINFNETVSIGLPPSIPFSDRADELEAAIEKSPAAGQTALYDAMAAALERLKTGSRQKKVLIAISDGGDNASLLDLPRLLKKAGESSAEIYTIGIYDTDDPDQNPDVLRRLARVTGGEAFFPAELDEVVAICERIASDIRYQYTIGYVSSNTAKPAGYRTIKVLARAAGKDLTVRTRLGYTAGTVAK